ncbi:MAG TPA: anthranilate phosphoribosyltransferase [Candidatus Eremiobacteraceae bacterium]|nr:anthranilate phosphoribosyltransferase [Candidatus Eremiobacteraceae bacterium]
MIDHIRRVVAGEHLFLDDMRDAVGSIMDGQATPAQVAALLVALALKGETADEIAGAAAAMRAHAIAVPVTRRPIVDVCGTGGDASGTFNISTAVAFVVAGAGVTVAKHGNRAMSSRCGSADVLEALGVRIDAPAEVAAAALEAHGIAFLFAQAYHPAMRYVAPVRREIGVRTLFNIIGPLSNPAGAQRQVVGVPRLELLGLVALALSRLGCERAAVVHGHGGLDELSLAGPNRVAEWTGESVMEYTIDPPAFGLERRSNEELAGGDAARNAELVRRVLAAERGAHRDVVALNAALALVIAGVADDLNAGFRVAQESIDDGRAQEKLDALVRATNR